MFSYNVFAVADGYMSYAIYDPYGININYQNIELNDGNKNKKIPYKLEVSLTPEISGGGISLEYPYMTPNDVYPFCKIGGDYTYELAVNPASRGSSYSYNTTTENDGQRKGFFSCRGTRDILDVAFMPDLWSDDDVILYCNNGVRIGSSSQNFGFLLSKANTYKLCVLKNLNISKENSTIVFGLDVGNFKLDVGEDPEKNSIFDFNTKTGSVIDNLELEEVAVINSSPMDEIVYLSGFNSIEKRDCINEQTSYSYDYETYEYVTESECIEWSDTYMNENFKSSLENICDSNDWNCNITLGSVEDLGVYSGDFRKYSVEVIPRIYHYRSTNDDEKTYDFYYNNHTKSYIFTDIPDLYDEEKLSVEEKFDLANSISLSKSSRVLLAKNFKQNNSMKTIFGYEVPYRNYFADSQNDEVYPVYIIDSISENNDFSDLCRNFIGPFDVVNSQSDFNTGTKDVYCSDDLISINSKQKQQRAFELFKNIIFTIKDVKE